MWGYIPEIFDKYGNFDDWIIKQSNLPPNVFKIFDLNKGQKLRHPGEYIAAIITGSHHNVDEKTHWISHLKDWIITAQYSNIYVLGICFGHQIIAEALGGIVSPNKEGLHIGSNKISLSKNGIIDPLFKNTSQNTQYYFSHNYCIDKIPDQAEILAVSENCPVVAFKKNKLYGVQFHPEFTSNVFKMYSDTLNNIHPHTNRGKTKSKAYKQTIISNFLDLAFKFDI